MSKLIKSLLIVLLSLLIIALSATMIFFIRNDFSNLNFGTAEMKLTDSYETDVNSVSKINLGLKSADVEIKESENELISVEIYSNTDSEIKIDSADNTLSVTERGDNSSGVFFNTQKKVIVFVPATYAGEYSLNTHSGDITAENDLLNNTVNASTHSGDIVLKNTRDITLSTSSGDITINKNDYKAEISTSSGEIEINEFNLKEVSDIASSSGDINIGTLDMLNNLNITSSSGDVEINTNKSNCYVETETGSGDVGIKNSDRKSDIVLKIKTSSGDIEV